MEKQLALVTKAYDRAIELGRKGFDILQDLPPHITGDPDYALFQKALAEGAQSSSGSQAVKAYLAPAADLKFIDLGCCLNLMFNGYDKWPSLYYAVDISPETIKLLEEYVAKKQLSVGALICGSIHETPFADHSFDIGACIGVLEYFAQDFVEAALIEAHRIIKPGGRFVLDIPDNANPIRRIMNLLEEHRGCPVKFDMSPQAFELLLQDYFTIEKIDSLSDVAMIQYFLRRK